MLDPTSQKPPANLHIEYLNTYIWDSHVLQGCSITVENAWAVLGRNGMGR